MYHNLNLNDEAAELVQRATDTIHASFRTWADELSERCARILPEDLYLHVGALFGTISNAAAQVDAIVFEVDSDDSDYGVRLNREAQALDRIVSGAEALAEMITASTTRVDDDAIHRYFNQMERGVITPTEFEALIAVYWSQRGVEPDDRIGKVDWMYDHDLLDAQQYWDALDEEWVEHYAYSIEHPPSEARDCDMCCADSAAEFRNAHIVKRFPQITGAPAVSPEGTVG